MLLLSSGLLFTLSQRRHLDRSAKRVVERPPHFVSAFAFAVAVHRVITSRAEGSPSSVTSRCHAVLIAYALKSIIVR